MTDQRLNRAWKRLHPNAGSAFDRSDELHIDDLACALLERYRSAGDAEAFALLFELMRPRLAQLAANLLYASRGTTNSARTESPPRTTLDARDASRAEGLVCALMREMHREGRAAPPRLSGFSVLAAGRMRGLVTGAGPDRAHPPLPSSLARSA